MARNLLIIIVLLVAVVAAWAVLTMPDQRTFGQRASDAVNALPNGVTDASRQFEARTPGQKVGDAIKDAGQNLKNNTSSDGH